MPRQHLTILQQILLLTGAAPRKVWQHLASTCSASAVSNAAPKPRPIHVPHSSNSIWGLRPLEEVHLVHAESLAQIRCLQAAVELLKRATVQPQLGALGTQCMCPTGPAVVYLLRCHMHAAAARQKTLALRRQPWPKFPLADDTDSDCLRYP